MKIQHLLLVLALPIALTACGQGKIYSDAEIQKICLNQKRDAEGPRGAASLSTGTRGTSVGLSVSLSESYIRGFDPEAVYAQCVQKYNDQNTRILKQVEE